MRTFGLTGVIASSLLFFGFPHLASGLNCDFLIKEGGDGPIVCEERAVAIERQPRDGTISGATVSVEARRVEIERSGLNGEGKPPLMEEKYTLVINTRGWAPAPQLGGRKLVAVNGQRVDAEVVEVGSDVDRRGVGIVKFEVGPELYTALVLDSMENNEGPEEGKVTVVLENAVLDISSIIEDLEQIDDMRPGILLDS